jgi:hypothetical protein
MARDKRERFLSFEWGCFCLDWFFPSSFSSFCFSFKLEKINRENEIGNEKEAS